MQRSPARRNRLIAWLLAMLAALGVVVVVISGGPGPVVPPATASPITTASPSLLTSAEPSVAASEPASLAPSSVAPSVAPTTAGACTATDQDQFVYHPARLTVLQPCITVTGTIFSMKSEADGDLHIRLTVDPAFANLINAVNVSGQLGKLIIEPVCEKTVTQADAQATCAADHDPINIGSMQVGQHVTMTGRYVTDGQHGGWAELHPLYSWAVAP